MACVKWNNSYNLGVDEIDAQHRRLIDSMNKLCDSLDKGQENYVIDEVLEEMKDYALDHLSTEENYFNEFHYEKSDEHKAQHNLFREKVASLVNDLQNNKEVVVSETIGFLGQWFVEHIQSHDREYIECFHKHGLF